MATRIRGKSKQTLESQSIESGTSCFESRALTNWATPTPDSQSHESNMIGWMKKNKSAARARHAFGYIFLTLWNYLIWAPVSLDAKAFMLFQLDNPSSQNVMIAN